MTRLRVDRFAVTSGKAFVCAKSILVLLLSFSLVAAPLCAAPSSPLGTVVYANNALVGVAAISAGATVFPGDRLSTEQSGSVQVRAGSARLLLSSQSSATLSQDLDGPVANIAFGSAIFSTANSKAMAVRYSSAVIRSATNQPTIGQVTVLGPKELMVKSTRGTLLLSVLDDVREIPEGTGYRVLLDPQGPQGAGTKGYGGPPIKAAKSKFIWYAIGVTAVITYFAIDEVFESPDRP
jgi:hypothetical protein